MLSVVQCNNVYQMTYWSEGVDLPAECGGSEGEGITVQRPSA